LNAVQEHAAFSSHYLSQGQASFDEDDEEPHTVRPLGSMQVCIQILLG
jgi:hypothetical protein